MCACDTRQAIVGHLGAIFGHLGAIFGQSWATLGHHVRCWAPLGPYGDHLAPKPLREQKYIVKHRSKSTSRSPLGPSRGHLGAILGHLGLHLGRLGTNLGHLEAIFGAISGILAIILDHLGTRQKIWTPKMENAFRSMRSNKNGIARFRSDDGKRWQPMATDRLSGGMRLAGLSSFQELERI